MPAIRTRAFLLAITCLALWSCGGGGGSEGEPAPVTIGNQTGASPPSSNPPPNDPPATNLLPDPPFGITSNVLFSLVGWQERSQGEDPPVISVADQKATLRWTASLKTYEINLVDLASGRLVRTFANNPAAFTIVQADGSLAKTSVTIWPKAGSMGNLYWQTADGISPHIRGQAVFGLPFGVLPTSGRRVFKSLDDPDGTIVFDFASRKVSGTVTAYNNGGGWDPEGPKETGTIEPADLQLDGSFVAVLSVTGAPRKGELRGRLFGSAGTELAVFWNAPVRDGYEGTWGDWRTTTAFYECQSCTG